MTTENILNELDAVLEARRSADPTSSYVASLYSAGLSKILEKIGEEATETIIAAKDVESASDQNLSRCKNELVKETADLWFHSLVALKHLDLSADDVLNELGQRFGVGGHAEKAARKQ